MPELLHQFITEHARRTPGAPALLFKNETVSYGSLQEEIGITANGFLSLGIKAGERVAVYLPKQPETVYGIFGALCAGASFVPINPLLKPRQVAYILGDCNVRVLITSSQRLKLLEDILEACPDLHTVVVTEDTVPALQGATRQSLISWHELHAEPGADALGVPHTRIDTDMAAILYTSGSTGKPKGVV
jgi:acyl-CoA synthetase (AMP-forming)/AMP-acid ligase II